MSRGERFDVLRCERVRRGGSSGEESGEADADAEQGAGLGIETAGVGEAGVRRWARREAAGDGVEQEQGQDDELLLYYRDGLYLD